MMADSRRNPQRGVNCPLGRSTPNGVKVWHPYPFAPAALSYKLKRMPRPGGAAKAAILSATVLPGRLSLGRYLRPKPYNGPPTVA
jgi:hypothetical protein